MPCICSILSLSFYSNVKNSVAVSYAHFEEKLLNGTELIEVRHLASKGWLLKVQVEQTAERPLMLWCRIATPRWRMEAAHLPLQLRLWLHLQALPDPETHQLPDHAQLSPPVTLVSLWEGVCVSVETLGHCLCPLSSCCSLSYPCLHGSNSDYKAWAFW